MAGNDRPRWVIRLVRECDQRGQSSVARELGLSPSTISLVLAGKYPASLKGVQGRVEQRYGRDDVFCPFRGCLVALEACDNQRLKPFSSVSPYSVAWWRACRGCEQVSGSV